MTRHEIIMDAHFNLGRGYKLLIFMYAKIHRDFPGGLAEIQETYGYVANKNTISHLVNMRKQYRQKPVHLKVVMGICKAYCKHLSINADAEEIRRIASLIKQRWFDGDNNFQGSPRSYRSLLQLLERPPSPPISETPVTEVPQIDYINELLLGFDKVSGDMYVPVMEIQNLQFKLPSGRIALIGKLTLEDVCLEEK